MSFQISKLKVRSKLRGIEPGAIKALKPILGPEISCTGGYQLRSKLPDNQQDHLRDFPWHQDSQYYGAITRHLHIVTVWIPLTDVDQGNGCLWLIPESQKWGLLLEGARDAKGHMRSSENVETLGEPVPVPMKAGEILLFHNQTFHCSKLNHSDQARWNFDIRYWATPDGSRGNTLEKEAQQLVLANMLKARKPPLVITGKKSDTYEDWVERRANKEYESVLAG